MRHHLREDLCRYHHRQLGEGPQLGDAELRSKAGWLHPFPCAEPKELGDAEHLGPSDAEEQEHQELLGEGPQEGQEPKEWWARQLRKEPVAQPWYYGLEVESAQAAGKRDWLQPLAKGVATERKEAELEPSHDVQPVAAAGLPCLGVEVPHQWLLLGPQGR